MLQLLGGREGGQRATRWELMGERGNGYPSSTLPCPGEDQRGSLCYQLGLELLYKTDSCAWECVSRAQTSLAQSLYTVWTIIQIRLKVLSIVNFLVLAQQSTLATDSPFWPHSEARVVPRAPRPRPG